MNTERVKRYDCTNGGVQFCQGCYQMEEDNEYGDYVKYEDYAALQKRIEELEAVISKKDEAIQHAISTYNLPVTAQIAEALNIKAGDLQAPKEGWISVHDRLPEIGVYVVGLEDGKCIYDLKRKEHSGYFWDDFDFYYPAITHWMPAAPTEGK